MPVTRRTFVQGAALGAVGSFFAPMVGGRGLEAFARGGAPSRLALPPGAIRLDSNENPNGPGDAALDAIRAGLGEASRYADASADAVRAAIAAAHGVDAASIAIGCGSTDIIRAAVYGYASPTRGVVVAEPTYESPSHDARRIGAPVIAVRVGGDLRLDLDAMAAAARGAGLVYVCNPNNPTSTVHGAAAVARFVDRVLGDSPETTILIDEAYHEYVDDPSYATAIPIALRNPRVIVARTFSKVYGMAGLRLGYAVAHPTTAREIARQALDLGVNHLAAVAGLATIRDAAHVERERTLNRQARAFTVQSLAAAGYPPLPSQANFVMFDARRDAKQFRAACRREGVLVGRAFPPLDTWARVSIGTMDEMQAAVEVFRRVLATA